jgi:hypothetical protein
MKVLEQRLHRRSSNRERMANGSRRQTMKQQWMMGFVLMLGGGIVSCVPNMEVVAPVSVTTPIPTPTSVVDSSSLQHKMLVGYQGWFAT